MFKTIVEIKKIKKQGKKGIFTQKQLDKMILYF